MSSEWEPIIIRKIKTELAAANAETDRTHTEWQESVKRRDHLAKELREETERIMGTP